MKKTLVAIAALLMTAATYGQGTVNFANRLSGVFDAPITQAANTTLGIGEVSGIKAQLLLVNGTSVTPIGSAIAFRGTTGALAKYFDGGAVEVPGVAAGASAQLKVRITGPTVSGGATAGTFDGPAFTQALGGGTLPPENMVNMTGFSVSVVPEPTTIALGMLGAAALVAARRRK
jgi:hypothetical protein